MKFIIALILCFITSEASADWIIIHKDTRVVKSITSDANPTIGTDEEKYKVTDGLDIGGQYKLDIDDKTLIPATAQEIADSEITQNDINKANYKTEIDKVLLDATVPQSLKNMLIKMKKYQDM